LFQLFEFRGQLSRPLWKLRVHIPGLAGILLEVKQFFRPFFFLFDVFPGPGADSELLKLDSNFPAMALDPVETSISPLEMAPVEEDGPLRRQLHVATKRRCQAAFRSFLSHPPKLPSRRPLLPK